MPGLFISLDGLDGCGKSTQCRLLAEWLRGRGLAVTSCVDPGGTRLGEQLREILLHHRPGLDRMSEALLFMASRAQLLHEVIRPALAAGHVVVSDRYLLANVVYQGHAGGLDPTLVRDVGLVACGCLQPDCTLVLDVPLEVARARRREPADEIERRDDAYHQRVRAGFLAEAERQPGSSIHVIDASGPVDAVQQAIRDVLAPWLPG